MSKKAESSSDGGHKPFCGNTIRIGGVGHRPGRLQHASPDHLLEQMIYVLRTTRDLVNELTASPGSFPEGETTLRVITSLAEGSDQLLAKAALALDTQLECPLPFARAEFERTFADQASIPAFRDLLAHADAVFEMNGDLAAPDYAYRNAAGTLLAQSDFLLAVWDGKPAAGIGGTPETIDLAQQRGIPVVVIEAEIPHAIRFNGSPDWVAALRAHLKLMLLFPSEAARGWWTQYLSEPWPSRVPQAYHFFTSIMSASLKRMPVLIDEICEIETPTLREHFRWSDTLAVFYAHRSRSAALRMQLWMSLSVIFAFLTIPLEHHNRLLLACSLCELASLVLLLLNAGRPKAAWHRRWLIYRSLAEGIRCLDFLAPLATSLPPAPLLGFIRDQDGGITFARMTLDRIARGLHLPSAVSGREFLDENRRKLERVLRGQIGFQSRTADVAGTVERHLHQIGFALFLVAALLCISDVLHAFRLLEFSSPWLTFSVALLPVLGAAAAATAAQGEYRRLAERASAMTESLKNLARRTEDSEPTYRSLTSNASLAAEVLTSEVRDWQVLVAAKPPEMPV